jgi:hypothetical protein
MGENSTEIKKKFQDFDDSSKKLMNQSEQRVGNALKFEMENVSNKVT